MKPPQLSALSTTVDTRRRPAPSVPPDTCLPLPPATSHSQPSLAELKVVVLAVNTDVHCAHAASVMVVLDHVEVENLDLGDVTAIDPEVVGGPGVATQVDTHSEEDEDRVALGVDSELAVVVLDGLGEDELRHLLTVGTAQNRDASDRVVALGEADMANLQPEVVHAADIDGARRDHVVLVVGLDDTDPGLRGVNVAAVAEHAGGRGTAGVGQVLDVDELVDDPSARLHVTHISNVY